MEESKKRPREDINEIGDIDDLDAIDNNDIKIDIQNDNDESNKKQRMHVSDWTCHLGYINALRSGTQVMQKLGNAETHMEIAKKDDLEDTILLTNFNGTCFSQVYLKCYLEKHNESCADQVHFLFSTDTFLKTIRSFRERCIHRLFDDFSLCEYIATNPNQKYNTLKEYVNHFTNVSKNVSHICPTYPCDEEIEIIYNKYLGKRGNPIQILCEPRILIGISQRAQDIDKEQHVVIKIAKINENYFIIFALNHNTSNTANGSTVYQFKLQEATMSQNKFIFNDTEAYQFQGSSVPKYLILQEGGIDDEDYSLNAQLKRAIDENLNENLLFAYSVSCQYFVDTVSSLSKFPLIQMGFGSPYSEEYLEMIHKEGNEELANTFRSIGESLHFRAQLPNNFQSFNHQAVQDEMFENPEEVRDFMENEAFVCISVTNMKIEENNYNTNF